MDPLAVLAQALALRLVHGALQVRLKISEICSLLNVDGIRGDIVINRAARALVAFEGRTTVELSDVGRIISICLNHRQASPCLRKLSRSMCLAPHQCGAFAISWPC